MNQNDYIGKTLKPWPILVDHYMKGLQEKPRTGRPAFLTPKQKEQLGQFIKSEAENPSGGRLTGHDIHTYIAREFDKHYHPDSIYYLLNHMGFSWITSRSKQPKQSEKIQQDFKKIQNRNDP
jgi:transposase